MLVWRHHKFFGRCRVSLSKISYYWFRGYDKFCLCGIDQTSGNHKYPRLTFVEYLNIGQVGDTTFSRNDSDEKLLDAAKFPVYRLCRFQGNFECIKTFVCNKNYEYTIAWCDFIVIKFSFIKLSISSLSTINIA